MFVVPVGSRLSLQLANTALLSIHCSNLQAYRRNWLWFHGAGPLAVETSLAEVALDNNDCRQACTGPSLNPCCLLLRDSVGCGQNIV